MKKDDVVTYEILVENKGNKDLTEVAVTDDHAVSIIKIEKVNTDGTRTADATLKRAANSSNLLGKTTLAAGEKYVITVQYTVTDNTIDEEATNGDKIINTAYLKAKELPKTLDDDDTLQKYKYTNITQQKSSSVVGNNANDDIINVGDIIEYTITVKNEGNVSGPTTVKDLKLKDNIDANKIVMMNGETELSKEASYTTKAIKVTSSITGQTPTYIDVNTLSSGYNMSIDNGEIITITFRVKVGKLLPGEKVENQLADQENTHIQNDVEASITLNKELVRPQNTVIVIDLSLSMAESVSFSQATDPLGRNDPMADAGYEDTRWYALTKALDSFLDTYMDGNNKVTIIGYNADVKPQYILAKNVTDKQTAKNSYANVLTREQFNSVKDKNDVDNLVSEGTGTLLASKTNIEAGIIEAEEILGSDVDGAKVIVMTDGEANAKSSNIQGESAIKAAERKAGDLKTAGATVYTVSLSLGDANAANVIALSQLASDDENGEKLSYAASEMSELTSYFKKISEILSEYHLTTTTKEGILYLSSAFNVDTRYVQNVVVNIPNDDGIKAEQTLTWTEFSKYYDATAKTINITALAKDRGIQGITGEVTITINVDTKIQS